MKDLLSNPYLSLLTRAFLGSFFIVISIDKIAEPLAFAESIRNYKLLPLPAVLVIATVLPWLELLAGLAILFGVVQRGSSLLLCLMLGVFTLAVASALFRGLDISCGCFTQDPSAGKIGWMKVAENGSLFLLSLFLLFSRSRTFTLESFIRETADTR
jgi:uncharacterized membrane protein YphA (DoxX/SURF4 family)